MNTNLPPLLQATSGAIGSAVGNAIAFPLDLATTRLQHAPRGSNSQKVSVVRLLSRLVKRKGWVYLYSGLKADTISTLLSNFLYFFLYTALHKAVIRLRGRKSARGITSSPAGIGSMSTKASEQRGLPQVPQILSAAEELLIGVVAGVASKAVTLPISAVCVRQQLGANDDEDEDNKGGSSRRPLTIIETLQAIHHESGVAGLFAGLPHTVPLALLPSLTLYTHALLLRCLPARLRAHPPGAITLLFGSLSNALTTIFIYPLVLAKALSQSGADKGKGKEGEDMIGAMQRIVARDGWTGLYKGFQAYRIKGVVQQGAMMLIKQRVEESVIKIYSNRF